VIGSVTDSNKVLVAQLTTSGEITFKLNLSVLEPDVNGGTVVVNYVASDDTLLTGEVVSPLLTYPQACGCNDPDYLEYSASYSCYIPDSCKTLIKFGCMDSMACNYDAEANFNIQSICCYPGYCNDLNISSVCPDLNNGRMGGLDFLMYPNPGDGQVTIELVSEFRGLASLEFLNMLGQIVFADEVMVGEDVTIAKRDLSWLSSGIYQVRLTDKNSSKIQRYIKNGN
jgi:hypothetical protein